ncbi:MAG: ABC transporter substrate-binding protein [Acetobacteraceae bacterium]
MKRPIWTTMLAMGALVAGCSAVPFTSARAQENLKCAPQDLAKDYPALVGKTVTIGVDGEEQPYAYRDPKDFSKIIGIDADLSRAVLKCVGIRYKFVVGGWSGLLPAVMGDQINIMWDNLYYTPVRAKKLDYVIYMRAADGVLVKAGNPKHIGSLSDACGLPGGALLGTVEEQALRTQSAKCVAEGKPSMRIMTAPNQADLTRLLSNGRADLIMNDYFIMSWLGSHFPKEYHLAAKVVTGDLLGVGLAKSETELTQAVYQGLRVEQANGTQKKILERYGVDPSLVLPAKIVTK